MAQADYLALRNAPREAAAATKARARSGVFNSLVLEELNRDATAAELALDTGAALAQGVTGLAESAYGLANIATFGRVEQGLGLGETFTNARQTLEQTKTPQLRYRSGIADAKFDEGIGAGLMGYLSDPRVLADFTAQQVASVVPAAVAGGFAARTVMQGAAVRGTPAAEIGKEAAKAAGKAASLTGAGQMGGTAYVTAYNQGIAEGLTPEEANQKGIAAGTLTGVAGLAISRIPGIGAAGVEGQAAARLARVPMGEAGTGFLRTVGNAARRETTEEGLQSSAEQMIQNLASERRQLMDGVGKAAALGALGGGILGAGMGMVPATANLRADLTDVIDSSAADAGVDDLASSTVEEQGEQLLDAEAQRAAAARPSDYGPPVTADNALRASEAQNMTIRREQDQALAESGFYDSGDGETFLIVDPNTREEVPFSRADALSAIGYVAPNQDLLGDPAATSLPPEQEPVLNPVQDPFGQRNLPDATGPERTGYQAYVKTRAAVNEVSGDLLGPLDDYEAIDVARAAGAISEQEARQALRYTNLLEARRSEPNSGPLTPRSTTPVTEDNALTATEVEAQQQFEAEEVSIYAAGYRGDSDGQTYYTLGEDAKGDLVFDKLSRADALAASGYVAPDQDLFNAPAFTTITPESAPLAYVQGEYNPNQFDMRGIDPLFETVDALQRQEAGVEILRGMAAAQPLGITMGPEAEWKGVLSSVVGMKNAQGGDQINYTASMKQSKLLNDFINGAVADGITPTSPEGFDYIMEQARAAETSDKSASKVIAALAEVAGAVAPGTAPLSRWRSALARKKIATPGQMKGAAYTKFKGAVAKATITPGSADFDTFMQNFSGSLTDTDAATPFGQKVRDSFPYTPPAVAQAKAAKAVRTQVFGAVKPTAKIPPIGLGIAPLIKSPQEKIAVDPDPEPITGAAEVIPAKPKTAKQIAAAVAKRELRNALNANAATVTPQLEQAALALNTRRSEVLAEQDDSGEVDADVAIMEDEAARPKKTRRQMSNELAAEANQVVARMNELADLGAVVFKRAVLKLRKEYGDSKMDLSPEQQGVEVMKAATVEILRTVDSALAKDVGDIASWGGLMQAVTENRTYAMSPDQGSKYSEFVGPMLNRFADLLINLESADAVRVHRTILQESGVADYITAQLKGKTLKQARTDMEMLTHRMDQAIDRMTADPANSNNVKVFKANKGRGMNSLKVKTDTAPGMALTDLAPAVERWNSSRTEGTPQFEVFSTTAEAEQAFGVAVPSTANGLYYDGRVALIAENITSMNMAREVMLHERSHAGLSALLGETRLNAVMNRLMANPQIRRKVQAKMKAINRNRIQSAEEVLVDMVISGETLNKGIFSKIRAAMSQLAANIFGLNEYIMPDSMVNELLLDTARYLRGSKAELNMSESYVDGLDVFQKIFEGNTVPKSPMFSTAAGALDDVAAGEPGSAAKWHDRFTQATRDTIRDTWKQRAGSEAVSIGTKISRVAMDLTPATQIAAWNRGLFYNAETRTDILEKFANDKLDKENAFNRILQDKRAMFYNKGQEGQQEYNESLVTIARDWQELNVKAANRPQVNAFNTVNQSGSFFKVHPDREWSAQTQINYAKENYTEADRRKAYETVRTQWNTMRPDVQALYRRVQASYSSLWAEQMAELSKQAGRIAAANTKMPDMDNPTQEIDSGKWKKEMDKKISLAIGRLSEGPYSPLQRFGEYYTVVRDAQGTVVMSSGHDTLAQANGMERSMREGMETGYTVSSARRQDFDAVSSGIGLKQYEAINAALETAFPSSSDSDTFARTNALAAMKEVMLQAQPNSSMLKHANTRKGIAGATTDSFRAFNDYAVKSARGLSAMRYDHKIQGALNEMGKAARTVDATELNIRRGEVFRGIQRQHLESQRVTVNAISTFATGVGFTMFMTSPSQLVLNASQTALVTMPVLAAKYGVGDTLKYLSEASAELVKSGGRGMHTDRGKLDPNSVMYKVMQNLNGDGTLDFTQSHDLSDQAQRESDLTRSRWAKVTHSMSVFMRMSEIYNREIAAYITVRGEMRKAGMSDEQYRAKPEAEQQTLMSGWTKQARDMVIETQFIYNQSNKPKLMQGNVGRVMLQFQQFRVNMLALIARTTRDAMFGVKDPSLTLSEQREQTTLARKTLSYMMGAQLALTGAAGSVLAPLAFLIGDIFDDEDELLNTREQFMQAAPQWVSMGVLSGFMDTSRFGFDTLLPVIGGSRYAPATDDPKKKLDHFILDSLGPTYGLATRFGDGIRRLSEGDLSGGIPKLLPNLFADPLKIMATEGREIKDRQGITWYNRSNWDMVSNFVGLKTGSQAEVQADRAAIYGGTTRASDRRQNLVGRYVVAEGVEGRAEAYQDIINWNQRYGADSMLKISSSTLKSAQKTRTEKERNALEYGVPSTRVSDTVRGFVE